MARQHGVLRAAWLVRVGARIGKEEAMMDEDLWLGFLQAMAQAEVPPLPTTCAWCWREEHPGNEPFPASWSSTLCPTHLAWIREHTARHRSSLSDPS